MNKVILMGRLTKDPEMMRSNSDNAVAICRYTLAIDRRFKRDSDSQTADFVPCVVFGKGAEFAEKYLHQGTKVVVTGRIQSGTYTNKDGQKVFSLDVVLEEQEFAESKRSSSVNNKVEPNFSESISSADGFMNIPDGIDEELPFN